MSDVSKLSIKLPSVQHSTSDLDELKLESLFRAQSVSRVTLHLTLLRARLYPLRTIIPAMLTVCRVSKF